MNLREEFLPFKNIIGRVILDKNPMIRRVVNKTAMIETVFRTFPMEVIAGEDDTCVSLKHSGALFSFDFRKVYWNTRLQHEHELLVRELIGPGSTVADGFAGVGPFAVPAAMPPRSCTVYANDLNPASHAALVKAVQKNKVDRSVFTSCRDGRDFFASLAARGIPFHHAILNLPADALSMCDVFVGLFKRGWMVAPGEAQGVGGSINIAAVPFPLDKDASTRPLPRVHLYCFARSDTEEGAADDAVGRLLAVLGLPCSGNWPQAEGCDPGAACAVPGDHLSNIVTPLILGARTHAGMTDLLVRCIRNVAPAKYMMCLSFTLPRMVAEAEPVWEWAHNNGENIITPKVREAQVIGKRSREEIDESEK